MLNENNSLAIFQLAHLFDLMVSLPELLNGWRYRLEIWFGNSFWKTGGPHAWLPTRECPQITSHLKKYKLKMRYVCMYVCM
jgi:hypothetical protein